MTMASALQSALSGLRAASRASDIVSANIANAMTPGYARREIGIASAGDAGGVRITGVERMADPALTQSRRSTEAATANAQVRADFATKLVDLLGKTEGPGSLTAAVAALDAALIQAASGPESPARLDRVAQAAADLATGVSSAGRGLDDLRSAADRAIAQDVTRLNTLLGQVRDLNQAIVTQSVSGADASGTMDRRQAVIDQINVIVPLREVPRDHGAVALYATGGAILLDGAPLRVDFSPANAVSAAMTLSNGGLSGLSLNDRPLDAQRASNPLKGGTLAAHFAVRDDLAVQAQAQIDAFAADLVARFASPGLDPTRPAGAPGLFTDQGRALAAQPEPGLAQRFRLNPAVDPSSGAPSWRLRDGLNASDPGPPGDASLLRALAQALNQIAEPTSPRFSGTALGASDQAAELAGWASLQRDLSQQRVLFSNTSLSQATQAEQANGVDTDTELSNLLLIEQAYAANARVLQTLDDMMETLLRLR